MAKVPGGRAREGSLHRRLANFHMGGEWFHLTPRVRAVIEAAIAVDPEQAPSFNRRRRRAIKGAARCAFERNLTQKQTCR